MGHGCSNDVGDSDVACPARWRCRPGVCRADDKVAASLQESQVWDSEVPLMMSEAVAQLQGPEVSYPVQPVYSSHAWDSDAPLMRSEASDGSVSVSSPVLSYLSHGKSAPASSTIHRLQVPMWGCPIATLYELGEFVLNEELVARKCLVNLRTARSAPAGQRPRCCFVSQTWLSFMHPDPQAVKYKLLCEVLKDMHSEALSFSIPWFEELFGKPCCLSGADAADHVRDGYVWMDYCSVPQRDGSVQQAYILSIPFFVQMCSLFMVLVPPTRHKDTGDLVDHHTWKSRGWCRMEALANILCRNPSPQVLVQAPRALKLATSRDWMLNLVGEGAFSCCRLNHILPSGDVISCDKERIAPVVRNLLDSSLKATLDDEDYFRHRLIQALRPHWMQDLSVDDEEQPDTPLEWFERFQFHSHVDGADSGWTPLRYAVYNKTTRGAEGHGDKRLDVAELLLASRADLESPLQSDFYMQVYVHNAGTTILQGAAVLPSMQESLAWLIEKKADTAATNAKGLTIPMGAAFGCAPKNMVALLDGGCNPKQRAARGISLLCAIAFYGNAEMLYACAARGLSLAQDTTETETSFPFLVGCLTHDISGHATAKTIQALLDCGAGLEQKFDATPDGTAPPRWKELVAASRQRCEQNEPEQTCALDVVISNLSGCTGLLAAAWFGNVPAACLLLEARADVLATNDQGRTALMLAGMGGHRAMCHHLLTARAPTDSKDVLGRDAADWAERAGDSSLAATLLAATLRSATPSSR